MAGQFVQFDAPSRWPYSCRWTSSKSLLRAHPTEGLLETKPSSLSIMIVRKRSSEPRGRKRVRLLGPRLPQFPSRDAGPWVDMRYGKLIQATCTLYKGSILRRVVTSRCKIISHTGSERDHCVKVSTNRYSASYLLEQDEPFFLTLHTRRNSRKGQILHCCGKVCMLTFCFHAT